MYIIHFLIKIINYVWNNLIILFLNTGKEEYAEIDCEDCENTSEKPYYERPHLFGVGAALNTSERNETFNLTYVDVQSISHNVGIYVWGAYQVKAGMHI